MSNDLLQVEIVASLEANLSPTSSISSPRFNNNSGDDAPMISGKTIAEVNAVIMHFAEYHSVVLHSTIVSCYDLFACYRQRKLLGI